MRETCIALHSIYIQNRNKIPYGVYSSIIKNNWADVTITKHQLSMAFKRYLEKSVTKQSLISFIESVEEDATETVAPPNTATTNNRSTNCSKGGCPKDTTLTTKWVKKLNFLFAKNEITKLYKKQYDISKREVHKMWEEFS